LAKRQGYVTGILSSDQRSLTPNPEECAALRLRKTNTRNGGTRAVALAAVRRREQVVSRMLSTVRIAHQANASGKATGYADMGTILRTVKAQVGVHTL
jgi:hypothetical protein